MEESKEAEIRAPIASPALSSVFPGFKLRPTEQELILFYLRKKVEGSLDRCVEIITEVDDICKHEPWDLPAKSIVESNSEWFFFTSKELKYPNRRHATETGYWKVTKKEVEVKSGSELIGTKRTLVFHVGRAPKGTRTEWIMNQYCMPRRSSSQDDLMVCRLRKKNKKNPKSKTKDESNGTSTWKYQDVEDVDSGGSSSSNSMERVVDSDKQQVHEMEQPAGENKTEVETSHSTTNCDPVH